MKERVTIEGWEKLQGLLRKAAPEIRKAFGQDVILPTTLQVEQFAKRLPPAGAPRRTGALSNDIHHRMIGPMEGEVRSGDTIRYAVPVHEGHRTRGGSTVAGNPYLRRAAKEAEADYRKRVGQFAERLPNMLRGL